MGSSDSDDDSDVIVETNDNGGDKDGNDGVDYSHDKFTCLLTGVA